MKTKKKNQAFVALGKLGGRKGGKARAANQTPEERSESASRAVQARWAKYGARKDPAVAERAREVAPKGGDARAKKLSPERRSEIASIAAEARWHGMVRSAKKRSVKNED